MGNQMIDRYNKEVSLERNGLADDGRNPLANTYAYECALYRVMSDMFESVICRSMCIGTLEMYFSDLPHAKENADGERVTNNKKRRTQEAVLDEVRNLVEKDVIGNINFPMMHRCAAEAYTLPQEDGSHVFVFTDGIYSFELGLDMKGKHPSGIVINPREAAPKAASEAPEGDRKIKPAVYFRKGEPFRIMDAS